MSTTPNVTESSLMISLADLTQVEQQRVQKEEAERTRARTRRIRAEREAEVERVAREAAEAAAQAEQRARAAREQATLEAQREARERVALEVARFEAEAKVRLEADNTVRAHELATLRVRNETGRRRREFVLAGLLAIFVLGGAVFANESSSHVAKAEQTAEQLREGQRALSRERDDAKRTDLAALDRRLAAIDARADVKGAHAARETAASARQAIDERALDHGRLRAFADAVDALELRIERIEKLDMLARRHRDLAAWAASIRRSSVMADAKSAAVRANAPAADAAALWAYEHALDELADTLAKPSGATGRVRSNDTTPVTGTCRPGDPSCGINGQPLF